MIRLEDILSRDNLNQALKKVVANKGKSGVDGMTCQELEDWIRKHPGQITDSITSGRYRPLPIRRSFVPKPDGSKRPLGIPTVKDRLVQQALANKLGPVFEPTFSSSSYGFRPGMSAHQAVFKLREYVNQGYEYIIDLDLKSFFDTIDRDILVKLISRKVSDGRIISLIRKSLNAKNEYKGVYSKFQVGAIQGSPISPLYANIYLDVLDKELEKRGIIKFVRYADDMCAVFKSERAAKRAYQSLKKFIEGKLRLTINEDKTYVGKITPDVKFLGFAFYQSFNGNDEGKWKITVHSKPKKKFMDKLRVKLNKKAPGGIDVVKDNFNKYLMGWSHYYYIGISDSLAKSLSSWYRRKIRAIYLKQWKNPRTIYENMRKLKTNSDNRCYTVAKSSLGIWAKAQFANFAITNKVIHEQ